MKRKVLIVVSKLGYQARVFTQAAEALGLEPVMVTDRCHTLEDPWGDKAVPMHFERAAAESDRVARAVGAVDGVVAAGDRAALAAAYLAERLGLRFHPVEAVAAARNKFLARERYRSAHMRVPSYFLVSARGTASEALQRAPFPCVLKPLGLSGSRGVIRADGPEEFLDAFDRIRRILSLPDVARERDPVHGFIQVESYVPGREYALEGVMTRGRFEALALFDKPDPLEGPYFEETIYVTPSRAPLETRLEIESAVRRAVAALGLTDGPAHAEARMNEQGAWVLEVAPRPIGGLCARALRFAGSQPLEQVLLRHALGEAVGRPALEGPAAGAMMVPIPQSGVYQGVRGVEEASAVPLVEAVAITAKQGQEMLKLPEGESYLGFIFARGGTPEGVEQALREAHRRLEFEFATTLPVLAQRQGA